MTHQAARTTVNRLLKLVDRNFLYTRSICQSTLRGDNLNRRLNCQNKCRQCGRNSVLSEKTLLSNNSTILQRAMSDFAGKDRDYIFRQVGYLKIEFHVYRLI